MKKVMSVVVLLLFLVACMKAPSDSAKSVDEVAEPKVSESVPDVKAPVQTQNQEQTSSSSSEAVISPPARPLPSDRLEKESAPAPIAQTQELSPQLRDLLKRSSEKLTSMQYLYGGTDTKNLFLDTYLVKGDKMKIKKYSEDYYVRDGYFDVVYVNLGVGCCETLSRCRSHNVDNTGKKFDVDVSLLNLPKTPIDWVKEIPATAKVIAGTQTFNERSVTAVEFKKNDLEYTLLVDNTYGIPHRVIIRDSAGNEVKHQFNDLKFNGLKDADFVAPCAK